MRKSLFSVLAAAAIAVALSLVLPGLLPEKPEWKSHMASHAAVGVPFTIAAIYAWKQSRTPKSMPSRAILIGMTGIGAFQLIEAASARLEYPGMGPMHGVSGLLTILSMAIGVLGLVGAGVRSVVGRQVSMPKWALVLLIAGALILLVILAKIAIGF